MAFPIDLAGRPYNTLAIPYEAIYDMLFALPYVLNVCSYDVVKYRNKTKKMLFVTGGGGLGFCVWKGPRSEMEPGHRLADQRVTGSAIWVRVGLGRVTGQSPDPAF